MLMIFTKEIANLLIQEGYKLEYKTKYAYCFKYNTQLQKSVDKLVKQVCK